MSIPPITQQSLNGQWLEINNDGICHLKFKPGYPVSNYVEHFLICKGIPEFSFERLLPNNKVELFFNLGDANIGQWGSAAQFDFKQTIISGLRSSSVRVVPGKFFYIVGMRFNLYGFFHLFRMPASEITDGNFSAVDVLGKQMWQMRQELGDADDPFLMIAKLYDWILNKIKKCDSIPYAWQRIDGQLKTSQFSIRKQLPQLLGYSYKHSLKIFRQICGLHPKIVQRIYRVNNLLTHGEIFADPNWAGLSYQFGFSDQSHLIKEFREFIGFTPAEFLTGHPKGFLLKQLR